MLNTCDPLDPQVAAEVNIDDRLVAADYHRGRKLLAMSVNGVIDSVEFWDVSNITSPQFAGGYYADHVPVGAFSASGNKFITLDALITHTQEARGGVTVLDVSDPQAPTVATTSILPEPAWKYVPTSSKAFQFFPGHESWEII